MEIKAKDMCPRCKYCLGMYSCGKANDGSELNIGIDVIMNCANFEWKDIKVEGKVIDFCPNCKNCKGITMEHDGKTASIRLTEVKCEDPYDGMVKTLDADSDICCSRFCDKISSLEDEHGKLKCKLLDILQKKEELEARVTELIKASKRKDELIQDYREKLKKANDENNLLNSKFDKLGEYYKTDEELINNIQKVIFPQEEGYDYTYSYEEILNEIRDLKIYGDENRTMYEEIKELRAKNQAYFNEIHERLAKHTDQCDEIAKLKKEKEELIRRYNMIAKKLNDIHDILKEGHNNE